MKKREVLNEVVQLLKQIKQELDSAPRRYYRNKHLKQYFGLSDNTIAEYRVKNILPWVKLGAIYFYPIDEVDKSFKQESNLDYFQK